MFNFAFKDVRDTIKKLPLALFFAWGDTKARYRRSVLGPFWLVLGTAVGVVGLGLLWSKLLKIPHALFIPSLAVGLVVWQLIAGCVTESTTILTRNASIIRNLKTPYLIFPVQLVLRQLINFAHNIVVVVVVLIVFPPMIGFAQLLLIPGLLLLVVNLAWITLLIGMLGARFRDLEQLVAVLMPMLFFVSPVIYRPNQLDAHQGFLWLNPFSYLISLIRDPIQGIVPPSFVYIVSVGMFIVGGTFTIWLLNRKYGRIAFWV